MKMPANCVMPDTVVVLISNIQKKYSFNMTAGSSKSVKHVHCFKFAGYIGAKRMRNRQSAVIK